MNKYYSLPVSIFFLITISCTSAVHTNDLLQSNWSIDKAIRNGRVTSTMEKGFFKFWNHDSLETNILGKLIRSKYHLNKNIIVSDSELPPLTVNNIGTDTLVLNTKINKYHFSFTLIKSDK